MKLERRGWVPAAVEDHVAALLDAVNGLAVDELAGEIEGWAEQNRRIHEIDCINLNPATTS